MRRRRGPLSHGDGVIGRLVDIRLQIPGTIKLTGKGNKTRIVPILEPTVKLLKQYLVENHLDGKVHKQYPYFVIAQIKNSRVPE